ncbi:MAG: trypsin-like peptidase domain-containing protein [Actinobacteria bacterium]|nr:trypsin-like peptidase domain-containing protein [Actinomycetota bacterium]
MRRLAFVAPVVTAALAALVTGLLLAGGDTAGSAQAPAPYALQAQFVQVVRGVAPSVVQIESAEGLGSGVVYDGAGHVVTNAHVVGSSRTFRVTLADGKAVTGTLVGAFVPDDLAVIRLDGARPKPARFADSSRLQVGDIVLAVGNPLGLRSSVTEGIVSALGRTVPTENGTLPNTIQTSAPINPGNSGGALVNLAGQVVGIPTAAAVDPNLGRGASGIGFAIASNRVTFIAVQLIRDGRVTKTGRAYLAVRVGDITGNGVLVGEAVAGGPAAQAGIRAGDVIVSIAGKPTPSTTGLSEVLATLRPGQRVAVRIVRQDGSSATVQVTLGELPGG